MPSILESLRCAVCVLAGFTLGSRIWAQTALPKDSPFLPPATAAVVAAGETYELAAVSTIGTQTSVSVYDKQLKKGKWISVGETVDGISVMNYDAVREQALVRVGGTEKVLALRKNVVPASGRGGMPTAGVPWVPPAGWNAVGPPPAGVPSIPASGASTAAQMSPPPPTPTIKQSPPPAPGSIAHQEQEARMLVSDLLEIGMAQRKAYEEAQKKAGEQNSPATPVPVPPARPVP